MLTVSAIQCFTLFYLPRNMLLSPDISRNHQSTDVTTGEITPSFLKDKTTSYFTFQQTGTSVLSKKRCMLSFHYSR